MWFCFFVCWETVSPIKIRSRVSDSRFLQINWGLLKWRPSGESVFSLPSYQWGPAILPSHSASHSVNENKQPRERCHSLPHTHTHTHHFLWRDKKLGPFLFSIIFMPSCQWVQLSCLYLLEVLCIYFPSLSLTFPLGYQPSHSFRFSFGPSLHLFLPLHRSPLLFSSDPLVHLFVPEGAVLKGWF